MHRLVTKAVHDAGGMIAMQILHSGRYGYHKDIVSASAIRAPINAFTPREMTHAEILHTIEDFSQKGRV